MPKWQFLLRHIRDIHEHDDELFLACMHGDIEQREWLREGTVPLVCVCHVYPLLCVRREYQGTCVDEALRPNC